MMHVIDLASNEYVMPCSVCGGEARVSRLLLDSPPAYIVHNACIAPRFRVPVLAAAVRSGRELSRE